MVLDELAAFEQTASQGAGGMGEAFRYLTAYLFMAGLWCTRFKPNGDSKAKPLTLQGASL